MPYEDRVDKLVNKIRKSIKNVRFDDLKKILEAIGYDCIKRNSGSHHTFRKEGHLPVVIPKANPVNPAYVRIVLEVYDNHTSL
ncbi:type II toxin-antitoxin system HicA family toxin [Campylobacter concisus]|uniref:type II toxin-antitoxin system HicA family toxin n=1 Tax=Campylobacter concisus TaxID=199 RepID=UPI00122C7E26|nr:type II toxin-antitoxin system HicA family toxin [Campylobacter concisus]